MGMTHGTIAGMLLTDLILGRPNPWAKLYDPSRVKPKCGWRRSSKENLNVAGPVPRLPDAAATCRRRPTIAPGTGAVMRRGLTKVAVYSDENGHGARAARRSARTWAASCSGTTREKTWDCPCHGSRFDPYGKVVNGPANSDLAPRRPAPCSRDAATLR